MHAALIFFAGSISPAYDRRILVWITRRSGIRHCVTQDIVRKMRIKVSSADTVSVNNNQKSTEKLELTQELASRRYSAKSQSNRSTGVHL